MAQNHIVHIADIHARFHSREEEYRIVLNRTIEDIKTIKPRRIVLVGDLFHIKINMSPTSITMIGDFITKLSRISHVDITIGNHDMSIQSLAQGNAIEPIVKLLPNGYIITKNNPTLPVPDVGYGIYLYKDSGFYDIDKDLVYGVYSCWDGEILTLKQEDKQKDKKYIALYHGALQGALGDNGYALHGDELHKISMFNNFSMGFFGDIHEAQSFELNGVERAAYSGSLLQQNFGESMNKGYLVWDIDTCTHKRRFIPNDYGYCRLNIYKGEIWEDRLEALTFSLNKKKTKVDIILHDDQENYSVEKLSQIEKYIRDRHGCEVVSADYVSIKRDIADSTDDSEEVDVKDAESAEKLLREFLEKNEYDNFDDVIELNKEVDLKLNIEPSPTQGMRIDYESIEISNLLSFPQKPTIFDLDRIKGLTGIFGPNYNGKSNVMKVFVWICYGKMPGDMDSHKLVNLYTGNNRGYGKIVWSIANVKYYAYRAITVKTKKDGSPDVSYVIEYKRYENVVNELTGESEMKWVDVESEKAATEKKEKKKRIIDYIGTYSDFMVSAMQTNDESYLSLGQQPKNDLINKFLGLEIYRERYDFANETFKNIKAKQKTLGNPTELEVQIEELKKKLKETYESSLKLGSEKGENNGKIDEFNAQIIDLTKKLHKIEIASETNPDNITASILGLKNSIKTKTDLLVPKELWLKENHQKELSDEMKSIDISNVTEQNIETINKSIEQLRESISIDKTSLAEKEEWLSKNFKKELQDNLKNLDKVTTEKLLNSEKTIFASEKEEYVKLELWLKENHIKEIKIGEQDSLETKISDFRVAISGLEDKIKIAQGEKCPVCNHVSHEPNPELEKKHRGDLQRGKDVLALAQKNLLELKNNINHNAIHLKNSDKLSSLKTSIQARHKNITSLKTDLELSAQKDEIIKHNSGVDAASDSLKNIKILIDSKETQIVQLQKNIDTIEKYAKKKEIVSHNDRIDSEKKYIDITKSNIESDEKEIIKLQEQIEILKKNEKYIIENSSTNDLVNAAKEQINVYKSMNLQLDGKLKECSTNTGAWNNEMESLVEKLNTIKETDRIYKKYSVYLQAVGRDGIPALIIRKKLPIINHKINSLLKSMVSFKVELFMKSNGDVKEQFYFSDNKTDTLPLSMGSGSIKFITNTAISDALHFASTLIKPSIKVIDEGFDTLDNTKLMELNSMFDYLKSKYKNIFIITHKSEVRDYVDNIIEVRKTKDGITDPEVLANPEAGISQFNYA